MTKKWFVMNAIAFVLAWLALPFLLACDKPCEEMGGVCACDETPEVAVQTDFPSAEKPPTDKMPSYQREGIVADMPQSMAAQDAKMDQERDAADKQGKKAAGL